MRDDLSNTSTNLVESKRPSPEKEREECKKKQKENEESIQTEKVRFFIIVNLD